jgi:hypothetical protein
LKAEKELKEEVESNIECYMEAGRILDRLPDDWSKYGQPAVKDLGGIVAIIEAIKTCSDAVNDLSEQTFIDSNIFALGVAYERAGLRKQE